MKISFLKRILSPLAAVALLANGTVSGLLAQNAQLIVAKGQQFIQTSADMPIFDTNGFPHLMLLQLDLEDTNGVSSVTVRAPNGAIIALDRGSDGFGFPYAFAQKTGMDSLDSSFPVGVYHFTIETDGGTLTRRITLGADAYPTTPQALNWTELQAAEAASPIRVRWNQFVGGTAGDEIHLTVYDSNDNEVFFTPEARTPGALTGLSNSVVIPAGTLVAGQTYSVELLFANIVTSLPDPEGRLLAGYFKSLRFQLRTLAPPPPAGRLVFSAPVFSENESQPHAAITVNRVGGTAGAVSVELSTAAGTAGPGADYIETNVVVSLPNGVASATVNVALLDDVLLEGVESVRLQLANPMGGADLGVLREALLLITDSEATNAGSFQLSVPVYRTTERSGKVSLMVMRGGGSSGQVSVDLSTMDGSAVAPGDYAPTNLSLVFSNGVRSRMIALPIANDAFDETNETFQVKLSNPTGGASLGARTMSDVLIMDDDTAGAFSFSTASYSVSETGSVANVTVKRSGGKAAGASVDFAAFADTASSPADFIATNLNLVFASNEVARVIPVPLNPDTAPEMEEQFLLTLRNPGGSAKLGSISNAVVRIIDDESSVSLTNASYTVNESTASLNITVVRSGALNTSVSVVLSVLNGTAVSPADFRGTNVTLSFGANIKSKSVSIPIVNDALDEMDETFQIVLSNPQGGTQLGSITAADVTILDNDTAGTVHFGAAAFSGTEGAGNASIKVIRTGGAASNVTVRFQTSVGGSATAGSDYTAVDQVLTFAAGETMKTVLVPILTDGTDEPVETVNLLLSEVAAPAVLGTNTAVLSIANAPDRDAVPLAGPEFFTVRAVGVTNLVFSRTFNAATFIGLINQGINNTYVIRGDTGGISGLENFIITVTTMTGPGRYPVTRSLGPSSAGYTRAGTTIGSSFAYGTTDPGTTGVVIIDGFDGTRISGRADIIMSDDTDATKWIRATVSFRATL